MSDKIEELVERAVDMAIENKHEYVTLEHLLYSLLQEEEVIRLMEKSDVDISELNKDVGNHIKVGKQDIVLDKE